MTQPKPKSEAWDRRDILAEVTRRGLTLSGIARAAGLNEAACRQALHGINRRGADALAEALQIPFDTLFPTGFVQSRRKATAKPGGESRQKRAPVADKTAAVR